jgi:hypothetical protein
LGVSVQHFTQLGGCTDLLRPFTLHCAFGLMQFYAGFDKGTASVHQILRKSWKMIRQVFEEESMSHTQVYEWESQNSLRPRKARHLKSKVKKHAHDFLWHQGNCSKEFILAGQTVNFVCYCDWKCANTSP